MPQTCASSSRHAALTGYLIKALIVNNVVFVLLCNVMFDKLFRCSVLTNLISFFNTVNEK